MARDSCDHRSHCPISFSLDILGDRWTLLVLRDLIFLRKQHFREFLASPEGIASNILTSRLKRLEDWGMMSRRKDPDNARQLIYAPTSKGLDLLPTLVELALWGVRYHPQAEIPRDMLRRMERDRETFISEIRAYHERNRKAANMK